MGYGKSGMGGAHPIMKHMTKAGGGTGTSQSMSKNADIKYGGSVIDQFKSPMKNMYSDAPLEVGDEKKKKKITTAEEDRKNFKTYQYRKGINRMKVSPNREKNTATRTGPDKVASSKGNKLIKNKQGRKVMVVQEGKVNKLTPRERKKLVTIESSN